MAVYTLEAHERTRSVMTEKNNSNFSCHPLKFKRGTFAKDKEGIAKYVEKRIKNKSYWLKEHLHQVFQMVSFNNT